MRKLPLLLLLAACGGATTSGPAASSSVQTAAPAYEAAEIDAAPPEGEVERYNVPIDGAPVRGHGRLVTIVQFSDFQCPFCARVVPTMERLLERYPGEVRIVFRQYPLPFHRDAAPAAMASMEVRQQLGDGAFWQMHDRLFENHRDLSIDVLARLAEDLGADPSALRSAVEQGAHEDALNEDRALAARFRVTGTPAQFVNGRPVVGAQPYEVFAQMVEEEIALARSQDADPQGDWYAQLLSDAPASREAPRREPPPLDTTVYHVPLGAAPRQGPETALVTLVAFTDFECPFCGRALASVEALKEQLGEDLRIVVRHFPLPFHRNAMGAHEAAQEAFAQGGAEAFFAMHDRLFANRTALGAEDLERYATEGGLDVDRFRQAMGDHRHRALVEADMELGRRLGVRGTPTFFLNGRRLVGAQPVERFAALAEEVSGTARGELASGTAPSGLYAALIEDGVREEGPPPEPDTVDELPSAPPIPEHAPRRGARNAAVTIQVFSDFQCPFCGRVNPSLERVLEDYRGRVNVVFRHMPLRNHRHARLAAEAAIEVRAQGGDRAFWRFHDRLFERQHALTREDLERYARELGGINLVRFRRALDEHRHEGVIAADGRTAGVVGVRGTPTLVVGRRILRGAKPYVEIEEILDEILDEE